MKRFIRHIACAQVLLQLLLPLSFAQADSSASPFSVDHPGEATPAASPFSVDRQAEPATAAQDGATPYASALSQGGGMPAGGHAADAARSLAAGQAAARLQQWLSGFGTARVQLSVDRHGGWSHSSGDLLVPLYDNGRSLLFVQGGIRKPADRLTGNLGYGVRTFWQSGWMGGANVFFDNDFTGHNRRVGVGGEAWRDYLRLSTNVYLGTSDWHASRDFDGTWQEKPADGYDVRAEGWLPAWPQLGGSLVWEQYYGQQVALFDRDHLQHNPHAVTAGVEYTPVPLITLGAGQRQGRGVHDTRMTLGVNWQFGQDWRAQLDPANVQALRTLAGSRNDLVSRNNEIVLQYRKDPGQAVAHLLLTPVTDNSPADGATRNVLQVRATNSSGQPLPHVPVSWRIPAGNGAALDAASSVTGEDGTATVTLSATRAQTVPVTAESGGATAMQASHFAAASAGHIKLTVTRDGAAADGSSADVVEAVLTDAAGRPVAGQAVSWQAGGGAVVTGGDAVSDGSGRVSVTVTATTAGEVSVKASAVGASADATVHFTADIATARIVSLDVTGGAKASGVDVNTATVRLTDADGKALADAAVTFSVTGSARLSADKVTTDAGGSAQVTLTDGVAETVNVTAALSSGVSQTKPSVFVVDLDAATLGVSATSGADADGAATNAVTVTVQDRDGNALADQAVTLSATGSAVLSATSGRTGSGGQLKVTVTDTVAESVTVTAGATGKTKAATTRFAALKAAAIVLSTDDARGNKADPATLTATVTDRLGNPVEGVVVTWGEGFGNHFLRCDAGAAKTNAAGQVERTCYAAEGSVLNQGFTATAAGVSEEASLIRTFRY